MESITINNINPFLVYFREPMIGFSGNIQVSTEVDSRDVYFIFDNKGEAVSAKDIAAHVMFSLNDTRVNIESISAGETFDVNVKRYTVLGAEDTCSLLKYNPTKENKL